MRKNKILSGVLAAVMAAALIPAMPADEINAEDISIKSGGSFYTVPADKSEPIFSGKYPEQSFAVMSETTTQIVDEKEVTVEKKYFDITLQDSGTDWKKFKDLGAYAFECTFSTANGLQFQRAKVGTAYKTIYDSGFMVKERFWRADDCEVNDNSIQFVGSGSNLIVDGYEDGNFGIRLELTSEQAAVYQVGMTEKIAIDWAIYSAEEAEAKWNLRPSQGLSKISVGKDELLSGANVLTVNNVDFYSNLPISVTYKSTSGEKSVRGCRVSLSDIDFDNYQDIEIVGSQEKNVDYVPVAWTAFQTKALSVSKQFTEIDDNGKYNERAIIKIASPQVGVVDHVDVTFTYVDNDNVKHKQTITTKKCYAAFKVGSDTVGENNCMFVIVTLRNIPDSIVPLMKDNKPCGLDIEYKMFY